MSQPKAFKGKDKRKRPLHLATIALVAGIAVVAWGFSGCSAARQPAPQGARMRSSRMYEDGSVKQAAGATRQALLRGTADPSSQRRKLKAVGDTTFTYQWFGAGQKQAQVQGSKTAAQGLTATVTAGRPPGIGIQGIVERGGLLVPVNRGPRGAPAGGAAAAAGTGRTVGGTGTVPAAGLTGITGRQTTAAAGGAGPVGLVTAGTVAAAEPGYGYPDYFQYSGLYGLDYYVGSSGLLGGALDYQDYGSGGGLGDGGAFQASLPLVSTPVGGGAFG